MRRIYKGLNVLAVAAALSISGCSDFLETNPSIDVPDEVLFESVDGVQTALNGLYRYVRNSSSDVEANGIISYQYGFDAAAQDIIVHESMGYLQNYYGHHLDPTRADGGLTSGYWRYFYTVISNANIILANMDDAVGDEKVKEHIRGQALALRGWAYFYLVRAYQQTYAIAKDRPGVPYYDTPSNEGKPRESVEVIYGHILDDLTQAVDLLADYQREFKSQINRSVARGILAEVYLTMENWEQAAATAKLARAGFPLMTEEEFQVGFNDWELDEWMWGIQQTDDQNLGNTSPFTLWANQTRGDRWTYDFYFVNDKFKELFAEDDVRNQFWLRTDRNLWTSDKFRDNEIFRGSVVFMRAAEMYLIEAEALARLGQDGAAKEALWALQDIRNAARSQTSGDALVADILIERRKELYGEGMAWWDMIRNQQAMNRQGDHPRKPDMPARSWSFILQIPTGEFNANPALTSADQNPYTGVFEP